MCDCKEKIVLQETNGLNIASEYWCPEHGYQTSCYLCNKDARTTELCIRHIIMMKLESIRSGGTIWAY